MSLYVSMTGANSILRTTNVHSNNLANVNTIGFRADIENVEEVPVIGDTFDSTSMVQVGKSSFDKKAGILLTTGNPLDLAIEGAGWFAVLAPDGNEVYTRAGNFQLTANGALTTADGSPVLGNGGPIVIPPAESISVGADGTISVRPLGQGASTLSAVDRVKLVNPPVESMYKAVDGTFRIQGGIPADSSSDIRVLSGALEGSNVNAVSELIKVLNSARQYEMQVKLMREHEQMQQTSSELIING